MKYLLTFGDFQREGELNGAYSWAYWIRQGGIYVAEDHIRFHSPENNYYCFYKAYKRWLSPLE